MKNDMQATAEDNMLPMSEQERKDLSKEAGYELSVLQAHKYRLRKIHNASVAWLLEETR